jgi:hypothetical protein
VEQPLAEPVTPIWRVSIPREGEVRVTAPNWMAALAIALDERDRSLPEGGMVFDTLANGTVLARDLGNGERYVVHGERQPADA